MTRVLGLTSLAGSIRTNDGNGIRAGAQTRGFGMPPVATQWFEGAGDGASYRGARVLPRVMDVQLKVYGDSRSQVWERVSLIARIFAPDAGDVRLSADLDGEEWFVDVRRTGGGDWEWGVDTDGATFLKTIVTAQAGDPFWQRTDEESKSIVLGGLGRGLIKSTAGIDSLAFMRVSSTAAFGSVQFSNSGDVDAWGRWHVVAPFTGFTLTSPSGEVLNFTGAKASGFIDVDMELGTVTDELGVNRYDGLASTPRFWPIRRGESEAGVALPGATSASSITVVWAPRRWVAF